MTVIVNIASCSNVPWLWNPDHVWCQILSINQHLFLLQTGLLYKLPHSHNHIPWLETKWLVFYVNGSKPTRSVLSQSVKVPPCFIGFFHGILRGNKCALLIVSICLVDLHSFVTVLVNVYWLMLVKTECASSIGVLRLPFFLH